MVQQDFAKSIDISPATLSSIFNERTRPTLSVVEAIKSKYPSVSVDWLMFGTGEPYIKGDEGSLSAQPSQNSSEPKEHSLFDNDVPSTTLQSPVASIAVKSSRAEQPQMERYVEKPQRRITEIRVFYDDQTWETFLPKK